MNFEGETNLNEWACQQLSAIFFIKMTLPLHPHKLHAGKKKKKNQKKKKKKKKNKKKKKKKKKKTKKKKKKKKKVRTI